MNCEQKTTRSERASLISGTSPHPKNEQSKNPVTTTYNARIRKRSEQIKKKKQRVVVKKSRWLPSSTNRWRGIRMRGKFWKCKTVRLAVKWLRMLRSTMRRRSVKFSFAWKRIRSIRKSWNSWWSRGRRLLSILLIVVNSWIRRRLRKRKWTRVSKPSGRPHLSTRLSNKPQQQVSEIDYFWNEYKNSNSVTSTCDWARGYGACMKSQRMRVYLTYVIYNRKKLCMHFLSLLI